MNRIKSIGSLLSGVLVVLLMLSSAPAFAQGGRGGGGGGGGGMSAPPPMGMPAAPTGTLEVTVLGPSGAPENGVKVSVIPISANKGSNKNTNAAGAAVFTKTNHGIYHIVGRKKGFQPAFQEYVSLNSDKADATLKLTAGDDRTLYFEDKKLEDQAIALLNKGMEASPADAERLIAQSLAIRPSADAFYFYGIAQAMQGKNDQAVESFKKAADTANFMLSIMPQQKMMGFGGPGGPGAKPGGPGGAPGGPGGAPGGPGGAPGGPASKAGGVPGGPGGAPKPNVPSNRQVYEALVQNALNQITMVFDSKADAAVQAKRFDEAIAAYDEAINISPRNPVSYSNKALVLMQIGRLDEALASVNKALEINPSDDRSVQVKKAVDTFIENAGREKENARIKQANDILNEGNKLLEDNNASAALKKYEEANSLTDEKQSLIWRQVGRARAKLKQDSEAVAAFKKAIELASADQVEGYQMSLAQYYLDSKRPDEALDVVVAGSKNPEQRLMDLYEKGKNTTELIAFSTAALERVIKLYPSNIDAVFELGQVYYMDKKDSQAQELLTRYVANGKDNGKIQLAKDLLTVIAGRNKPKP